MNRLVKIAVGGALALAASSSFAAVSLPSTGDGSLTLTLFSNDDGTPFSYGFDTGVTLSTLGNLPTAPGATQSWSLSGLSADLSGFTGTSSLVFDVSAAGQAAGAPAKTAGLYHFATTFDPSVSLATITAFTNVNVETAVGNNGIWLSNFGTGQTSFSTGLADANYANAKYPSNYNAFGDNAAASVGTSLPFYLLTQGKGATGAATLAPSTYAGTWSVDLADDTLTYSVASLPTPLPAGLWLLLSGLTGMGLLGRRRREGVV
jgi:hypothetical protein